MISYYNMDEKCLKLINEDKIKIFPGSLMGGTGNGVFYLQGYFIQEISYGETNEGRNFRAFTKTNWFIYDFLFEIYVTEDYIEKVETPLVNFKTGRIEDKPGVFLNFNSSETLDEQLANIYELTVEEQELMKNSIKPWKDKLSLTADGLY